MTLCAILVLVWEQFVATTGGTFCSPCNSFFLLIAGLVTSYTNWRIDWLVILGNSNDKIKVLSVSKLLCKFSKEIKV